jgi:toxin secretion/phage lysis holin
MKTQICTVIGAVGGVVTAAIGGWDASMQLLVLAMVIDYITGILVAGVWHKSAKSANGALESRAGFKGLIRKGCILAMVLIAHYMDMAIGTQYIRDALVIGFAANEIISILENLSLMGVQYPQIIQKALDIMQDKSQANHS